MRRVTLLLLVTALVTVACGIPAERMQPRALGRYDGAFGGRAVIASSWMRIPPAGVATVRTARFARHRVHVYFTRESSLDSSCARTIGFSRRTFGVDVLHDAISLLMRGPRSSERREGATSLFSTHTAGLLNGIRIADGTAFIDFDDLRRVIPGASSSCGSAALLGQLRRTAKQFPTVDRVLFSLEGSRKAFYNWLQLAIPNP